MKIILKRPLIIPYKYKIVSALLLMIAIYKALYKVKCKVMYKVMYKLVYKDKVQYKIVCIGYKICMVGTFFRLYNFFMMHSYL